jgi:hypothetical protein
MTDKIRAAAIEAAAKAILECDEDNDVLSALSYPEAMATDIARAAIYAFEAAMWRPIEELPLESTGDFLVELEDGTVEVMHRRMGMKRLIVTIGGNFIWDMPQPTKFRTINPP